MADLFPIGLGDLLKLGLFLIMAAGFAYSIKADVKGIMQRLGKLEEEMHDLRKVVVSIARQEERMNAMDLRMISQGKRVDNCEERVNRFVDSQAHHA